jgi:hypothetical protein
VEEGESVKKQVARTVESTAKKGSSNWIQQPVFPTAGTNGATQGF